MLEKPVSKSWTHSLLLAAGETKQDNFRRHINKKFSLLLDNYFDLYAWSVQNYAQFWEEYLAFSGMIVSSLHTEVVQDVPMDECPKWFRGCKLNYAENLLKKRNHQIALYVADETLKNVKTITFLELYNNVSRYTKAMRTMGVRINDRVCGYLGNTEHAIYAYLATASIGAIWSSTSPDIGVEGVVKRFEQIQPKLIFAVDKQIYGGRVHDKVCNLKKIVKDLNGLERVVVIPYYNDNKSDISHIKNASFIDEFLPPADEVNVIQFEQLSFDHPLCILFSSGTTGRPKCMVHSVGGTLIQHLKEHELHGNLKQTDVMFYYTTTGWMMWNWLVSALATGSSIVLFEGAPILREDAFILWALAERIKMTVFGTSAKYLAALEEYLPSSPGKMFKLDSLHTILSTGSTLMPHSFDFVYNHIKSNVLLGSISGGSDIVSCFAGQNCTLPVFRGEIQSRNLAMDMRAFDSEGRSVMGVKGELVCCSPFPSMPVFFWNDDDDGNLYKNAYFRRFKGVWHHGDFCLINPVTQGVEMLGRSDATLNPNGVRFGSVEIYNIVETLGNIDDSLCVAYMNKKGDEKVVLFVKMKTGFSFDDNVKKAITIAIRSSLSPRHVPSLITEVKQIPYTINGKKVEIAVKRVINGEDYSELSTLSNPESLDFFRSLIPQLAQLDSE